MPNTIINIIQIVLSIIESALSGDKDAQKRLKDFLPAESYTQLVKEVQDKADLKKFGPRS